MKYKCFNQRGILKTLANEDRKAVVVHDDCSNLLCAGAGNLTRSSLEQYLDVLALARPDVIAIDAAIPDLCYYGSKVDEYWGQSWNRPYESVLFWNLHHNMKGLIESGNDPMEVICTRLHKHGLRTLAAVRMNDCHRHAFMQTSWERKHPEWALDGTGRVMDYTVPEVREHRFAIVREIVERFDFDGIGLDFIRCRPFFSSPAAKKADLMTQFVRDVRRLLDGAAEKKGKALILGVFCQWDLNVLKEHGIDVPTWISEGLLDYVCPSEEHYVHFNMPIEEWIPQVEGSQCILCPSIFGDVADWTILPKLDPHGRGTRLFLTMEHIRACALNAYAAGADGISLYNFYTFRHAEKFPMLGTVGDPAAVRAGTRHYFYTRTNEFGGHEEPLLELRFTPSEDPQTRKSFKFKMREHLSEESATLGFKAINLTPMHQLIVDINGVEIPQDTFEVFHPAPSVKDRCPDGYPTDWWLRLLELRRPIGTPPIKIGDNEVGFRMARSNPRLPLEVTLGEIEIRVQPR